MKKSFILLLAALSLASTAGCKGQTAEREDYVSQDGFYFSREGGSVVPTDTALWQGFLSDGTRYFVYRNAREDYAPDSCIIQRAIRDGEQALIVVGNINPVLAIDELEAIVQIPDSVTIDSIDYQKGIIRLEKILRQSNGIEKIPLYTEANYYRFGGMPSQYQGRIDFRIPIIPAVHPDLRPTSFSLQHFANYCLLSLYVDYKLMTLKANHALPESIEDVEVYPNLLLDGKDRECLCFHIEAKAGKEEQAKGDLKRCLEMAAREECTELQLNLLRENFRQMAQLYYFDLYGGSQLGNHAIIKRIADAYVLGNELYEYKAEGEKLISSSACCYTEFINAMYEATILHNPNF